MATILVVDDEISTRCVVKEYFSDKGYEVLEAADVSTGMTVAKEYKPDLILADFIMPGPPGENFFKLLESHPETKNIPLIIISGLPAEKIQSYIPVKHWKNIMSKPLEYKLLTEKVKEFLNGKAPA